MKRSAKEIAALALQPLLAINAKVATSRSTQLNSRESPLWQKMKLSDAKNADAYWCVIANGASL
jgi:hypothetical protein